MNPVKRFTARSSREAFALVRQTFGEDAVVLSTRPANGGVEVLAMAADAVDQMAQPAAAAPRRPSLAERVERREHDQRQARLPSAEAEADVGRDVEQLAMSTLSFQDYVRERMLRRRQAALEGQAAAPARQDPAMPAFAQATPQRPATPMAAPPEVALHDAPIEAPTYSPPPVRRAPTAAVLTEPATHTEQIEMMNELRAMKGLIEARFGALAFMEKLQRHPGEAMLVQRLLDVGFSPGLVRKLVDAMPQPLPAVTPDELAWATAVLERNILAGEHEPSLESQGGVYALIGSTGVGKTTSTAKLAAAFATQYGAANLGLITLDAYRVGAQEQLRAYGRILGVPVHTAHDRASLEDLLELLSAKRMVLIDTAGMAQRDARTRELLDMLSHPSIQRLLVVDAAAQGETIDDVVTNWRAAQCKGVILSKLDEAVKLAPALDAVIRHKLKVLGVANGQRVPEDWHRLSASALLQQALRGGGAPAYRLHADDVQLVFAAPGVNAGAGAFAHA
ncbi:MAG: flagellar biosynthesis protein FlhF [Proteobacteria bacterium]|nr:flagellar biosynthesis protein FlhF [Pseudomonadota bacterium]